MLKKLLTGVATAGILAAGFAPAAFASDTVVANNGALSDTTVSVNHNTTTDVNQNSETNANIHVNAVANTGGNTAEGGSILVNTGNATNDIAVGVRGGSNTSVLPSNCGCDNSGTVAVVGNGALSYNDVHVNQNDRTSVNQNSTTNADVQANTVANTGGNQTQSGNDNLGSDGFKWLAMQRFNDHMNKMPKYNDYYGNNRQYMFDQMQSFINNGFQNRNSHVSTGDAQNSLLIGVESGSNQVY